MSCPQSSLSSYAYGFPGLLKATFTDCANTSYFKEE